MDEILKICGLLADKKSLFLEFEAATRQLCVCAVDDVETYVKLRQELIAKIDELDASVAGLCGGDELMLAAAHNQCAYGDLTKPLQQVFEAAQEVFAVASRAQMADERAMFRIREERDELQEKIRANNRGMEAQAAKFYGGEAPLGASVSHLGNA